MNEKVSFGLLARDLDGRGTHPGRALDPTVPSSMDGLGTHPCCWLDIPVAGTLHQSMRPGRHPGPASSVVTLSPSMPPETEVPGGVDGLAPLCGRLARPGRGDVHIVNNIIFNMHVMICGSTWIAVGSGDHRLDMRPLPGPGSNFVPTDG